MPVVNATLAAKITEIVQTGKSSFLERLRREVPPAVTELLKIPGLGPKRVRMLYQDLERDCWRSRHPAFRYRPGAPRLA